VHPIEFAGVSEFAPFPPFPPVVFQSGEVGGVDVGRQAKGLTIEAAKHDVGLWK
jgi:hypothetical protein